MLSEQTTPNANPHREVLRLPGNKEVTITFAETGRQALKTAKEILIQHGVNNILNNGLS